MGRRRVFTVTVDPDDPNGLGRALADALAEAQKALNVSNRALQGPSGIPNQNISRLHARGDSYCSTFQKLFRALGVRIEIKLTIPSSTRRPRTR